MWNDTIIAITVAVITIVIILAMINWLINLSNPLNNSELTTQLSWVIGRQILSLSFSLFFSFLNKIYFF